MGGGPDMRRKSYHRNTEAVYTLSSILLNPLIEYKIFGGQVYATPPGRGTFSVPVFDSITKDFWIVSRENSLLFEGERSMFYAFTAMLGYDEVDEDSFNVYVNCVEGDVMVKLI